VQRRDEPVSNKVSSDISELYVHRSRDERMELLRVTETTTIAEAVGLEEGEVVWIEETEEELQVTLTLAEAGIQHRDHVHVNRCRTADVKVIYNGTPKERDFAPPVRVERVREWAVSKNGFDIDPVDAADLFLVIAGTTVKVDLKDHVGSYVGANCKVSFELISKPKTEG
jgi:hypothetical protein